ncbi:sigma-54-dependent transcriptional regulator [Candidatus Neomarinimicrobiota bacterium]
MAEKVLIVDDEKKICSILTKILSEEGFGVNSANSGEEAIKIVSEFTPELIIMDQNMPGLNGIDTMSIIKNRYPDTTIIILTAHGSIPMAIEATKKGAYDYISKPFDNEELMITIQRAIENIDLRREVSLLKQNLEEKYGFKNIIGISPRMKRVFEQIRRVSPTKATILVQGETGTGKELIVKAIHYYRSRKDKPFVAVNCSAIPYNLIESELFGYEKGAFTDAKERRIGKFEQADGGTLFLDEIGELPLDAQVKILRVLEERSIIRLGGSTSIPVDIQIITATNKNLEDEVKNETFRLDLLYRLNVFTIIVPALRERKEDIPLLIDHFIDKHNKRISTSIKGISKSTLIALQEYHWPGNVRELENVIESAMILASGNIIQLEQLPLRIRGYPEITSEMDVENNGLAEQIRQLVARMEKELILNSLEKCGSNRTLTAEYLHISRKTLFNKMKRYGINEVNKVSDKG